MHWNWEDSEKIKPLRRSKLRIYLGTKYYRTKRRIEWYIDNKKYASTIDKKMYPFQIKKHKSILRRQLKDVEMWYQENKIVNLRIAINKVNGIIIHPGETFSYWKLIGQTSKRKGYKKGMLLHYGTFKSGTGGGLCQLSNLIYWITLHTPLTVIERHRHSYDVFPDSKRTQPFGSGATCAYNYLDLQILNRTNNTYQLCLYLTETHLVGEWRAINPETMTYEVYEKDHRITHEHWGGYVRHNTIYRKVCNGQGEQIDDEYITENHALMMYNPLLAYEGEEHIL
ncbi:Vancomycin B-type resistance protein VanW [Paraliobacillus sp. PM-2]|uniref:VanW family protein n=1 Tax=Paraliobacillus sp. PM-2 TaxID=1462524 RepID=UPI00061C1C70|nr:VanW family protein [Paraliobacillus sp. PM-2]CQR48238.1 Vancomycin B-type resistance protein VanW [Paraliobacillus sp. PM-2]